jgi:hypothetical protein
MFVFSDVAEEFRNDTPSYLNTQSPYLKGIPPAELTIHLPERHSPTPLRKTSRYLYFFEKKNSANLFYLKGIPPAELMMRLPLSPPPPIVVLGFSALGSPTSMLPVTSVTATCKPKIFQILKSRENFPTFQKNRASLQKIFQILKSKQKSEISIRKYLNRKFFPTNRHLNTKCQYEILK